MGFSVKRHRARKMALQALYQWQFSQSPVSEIEAQFITFNDMNKSDGEYFHELLHQIPANLSEIDKCFETFLDRPFSEINPVELAILRIGTYELSYRLEIPYRIVIDEALQLAKTFSAPDAYKYVNAILDKVAKQTRQTEK